MSLSCSIVDAGHPQGSILLVLSNTKHCRYSCQIILKCLEKAIQGLVAWPTKDYAGTQAGSETEFCLAISEGTSFSLTGEYGDGSPIETLKEPGM